MAEASAEDKGRAGPKWDALTEALTDHFSDVGPYTKCPKKMEFDEHGRALRHVEAQIHELNEDEITELNEDDIAELNKDAVTELNEDEITELNKDE
ncbi:hypothetical protein CYMTET_29774, partial [Cymbomonas tetramitiformis]